MPLLGHYERNLFSTKGLASGRPYQIGRGDKAPTLAVLLRKRARFLVDVSDIFYFFLFRGG